MSSTVPANPQTERVSLQCPNCGMELRVQKGRFGNVICPICEANFQVDTRRGTHISLNVDISTTESPPISSPNECQSHSNLDRIKNHKTPFYIFLLFGSFIVVGCLIEVAVVYHVKGLVFYYGWGHAPAESISYTSWIDHVTQALLITGVLGSLTTFVYCLYLSRKAGETEGLTSYKWSWKWTVASLFIPLLFIVRPWLGFAEIYKSWKYARELKFRKTSIQDLPFSWATLFLCLVYILATVIGNELGRLFDVLERMQVQTPRDFAILTTKLEPLILLKMFIYSVTFLYTTLYLRSILNSMREYYSEYASRH